MVSTPKSASSRSTLGSGKRDTATTRLDTPARPAALPARMASVGPILPPAPSMSRQPSIARMAPASAAVGAESTSSSSAAERMGSIYKVAPAEVNVPWLFTSCTEMDAIALAVPSVTVNGRVSTNWPPY